MFETSHQNACIPLRANIAETQFQRHIKPRQVIYGVEAYFGYVVNTKLALFNDALDLREAAFA